MTLGPHYDSALYVRRELCVRCRYWYVPAGHVEDDEMGSLQCAACWERSTAQRGGEPVCTTCRRLSAPKWDSAVEEAKRITRDAETLRRFQKGKKK